ncbi:MAG TPA: RluA family pseudouridine synthase [Vicinamibacterales bacterium]|nr:RluA family pseudouridine synthase [Vicinamibacterales bacterium]
MIAAVVPDRGDVGVRIDRVLLRHLGHIPGITRNRLQRLIALGAVTVNGRPVSRSSARIASADAISVTLPERKPRAAPVAEDLPLDIRHEDDDLLVVDKPAGQVSHPAFRHSSGTLLNALMAYANGAWAPSLVSRLDKGTSGLVLVAKQKPMHAALQRLSHDNAIDKEYLAIVAGKPPARGTIDLALDRDPWDARRVTVRDRGGVPSITTFARVRSVAVGPDRQLSLVRCRLVTGRMHQIRVHLAAKGWPIVGDATYGVRIPGLERQALHAWRLAFTHPSTGNRVDVTAPPPADMAALLARFDAGEIR